MKCFTNYNFNEKKLLLYFSKYNNIKYIYKI